MTTNRIPITLIGEEIAGAWNETALADIAQVFGGTYLSYDGFSESAEEQGTLPLQRRYDCLMAAENLPGAQSVYTFRPPREGMPALLVGNEAKGLRRQTRKQAHAVVEIPLISKNINCLNVAAAAAVMLYYLSLEQALQIKQRSLASIQQQRPDLLLIGGGDAMELGSALRSACAFGWERVFLDDPGNAWYACDRRIKSEGRGAARRGRNPIKVIPHRAEYLADYRRMVVFTTHSGGHKPYQISLTGQDLLLVLPEETASAASWSPPSNWNGEITYAALPQASPGFYHYRQTSSIALAETARQLGQPASDGLYLKSRKDRYRREIERAETGTMLDLEDLRCF